MARHCELCGRFVRVLTTYEVGTQARRTAWTCRCLTGRSLKAVSQKIREGYPRLENGELFIVENHWGGTQEDVPVVSEEQEAPTDKPPRPFWQDLLGAALIVMIIMGILIFFAWWSTG